MDKINIIRIAIIAVIILFAIYAIAHKGNQDMTRHDTASNANMSYEVKQDKGACDNGQCQLVRRK